jgi:hypothetical protein
MLVCQCCIEAFIPMVDPERKHCLLCPSISHLPLVELGSAVEEIEIHIDNFKLEFTWSLRHPIGIHIDEVAAKPGNLAACVLSYHPGLSLSRL